PGFREDPCNKSVGCAGRSLGEGRVAMAPSSDLNTEGLIERARRGDDDARQRLLEGHRARLRRVIAVRLDRRLLARLDPSDVVQDALVAAASGLDAYLRDRPLPFFAWLRQFAWERMIELHRRHVRAQSRSVVREEPWSPPLPDESVRGRWRRSTPIT